MPSRIFIGELLWIDHKSSGWKLVANSLEVKVRFNAKLMTFVSFKLKQTKTTKEQESSRLRPSCQRHHFRFIYVALKNGTNVDRILIHVLWKLASLFSCINWVGYWFRITSYRFSHFPDNAKFVINNYCLTGWSIS